jgi:ribosomal-protein-alanine N-acetyltransferase
MNLPVNIEYRLARVAEAERLAAMSRDLVETGLGWSWTPSRIARQIRFRDSTVLVAQAGGRIAGFAIMRYGPEEAHLDLLAVHPAYRRAGVGRRLIEWLEQAALVAGVSIIYLEVRADNRIAQRFYRELGYRPVRKLKGYYRGRETAICMGIDLWESRVAADQQN